MVLLTMLAAWLAMIVAPRTAIGRWLRQAMVIVPARALSRVHRGVVLLALATLTAVAVLIWLGGADAVAMLGFGSPEMVGVLAAFDLATYVDVAFAVVVAASALRVRGVLGYVRERLPRRAVGRQSRRAHRRRVERRKPANNDDGEGGARIAA